MAGVIWKMGTRRGIVYVEGRATAERVLALTGRAAFPAVEAAVPSGGRGRVGEREKDGGLPGTMAVYTDRRGRPFAWQIPFDIGHLEKVTEAVGGE